MIANHLQFDAVKVGVFHPNQLGSMIQQSTEDAGLILTHIVHVGWAKGLKTSVVMFDIVQFFPSLNHNLLVKLFCKQGFAPELICFFVNYLVNQQTCYCWNTFVSDPLQADVGVGQGRGPLSCRPFTSRFL